MKPGPLTWSLVFFSFLSFFTPSASWASTWSCCHLNLPSVRLIWSRCVPGWLVSHTVSNRDSQLASTFGDLLVLGGPRQSRAGIWADAPPCSRCAFIPEIFFLPGPAALLSHSHCPGLPDFFLCRSYLLLHHPSVLLWLASCPDADVGLPDRFVLAVLQHHG